MNTTVKLRIVSFVTAAFLTVSGFWMQAEYKSMKYKRQIENGYSKALYELNSGLNNISLMLEKAQFIENGKNLDDIATKLYTEASFSKNSLSRLPINGAAPETLGKFLSQVGNYALSVSKNIIKGEEITEEQKNNIKILSDTASSIAKALSDTEIIFNNHGYWEKELEGKLNEEGENTESVTSTIGKLEENLTDFPTLVYDGPFSDHILSKEPEMLKGKPQTTRDDAEKLITGILNNTGYLKYTDVRKGDIPVHRFDSETLTAAVSKQGGYPVYLCRQRRIEKENLSYEQALSKARQLLNQLGIKNMTESYYFTDNGVCVINFASVNQGVVCYTDLIKVGIALDNGEIALYEAGGYLFNHKERNLEVKEVNLEKAKTVLSDKINIISNKNALIPTDSGNEMLCHEFLCVGDDGKEILIFLDENSYEEIDILILLKTDGGTLVK